jgi:hypothetical protein
MMMKMLEAMKEKSAEYGYIRLYAYTTNASYARKQMSI